MESLDALTARGCLPSAPRPYDPHVANWIENALNSEPRSLIERETWQRQYRQRPYLREASTNLLAERFRDVCVNLITCSPDAVVNELFPEGRARDLWMQRAIHLIEEYRFRNQSIPSASVIPISKNNFSPYRLLWPAPGQVLVKIGKRDHMQEFIQKGRIRICPASSYSASSHNSAVRDHELELEQFGPGVQILVALSDSGKPVIKERLFTGMMRTAALDEDFYIFAMTHTMSDRLFDDFEKDSCVVINNTEVFSSRLRYATSRALKDWRMQSKPVRYLDPYTPYSLEQQIDLFFTKDFRHWYQQEYRFAWIRESSISRREKLEPFFVELGPLKEIAEIMSL